MTAFYLKEEVQNKVREDLDSELREKEEDDPTKQTNTEFKISEHYQIFPSCFSPTSYYDVCLSPNFLKLASNFKLFNLLNN